jgi:iron complex transport system substrate-binding protein
MTRRLPLLIGLFLASLLSARAAETLTTPHRIVSLTPANTEMLFALGLGGRVVGDTVYCDYPAGAASPKITKIGDTRVNYEQVTALRPDLIVGDDVATQEADARLSRLGLPVLALHPTTVNGVEWSLLLLGQRTGTAHQARLVVAKMEAERRLAQALTARDPRHPTALIVIGLNPLYVAGRGTFMGDVLTEAGGVNAATLTGYGALSKEVLLAHPPDVILAGPGDITALRADPVLRLLPAVRAGRFVPLGNGEVFERPGPRITDGLLGLARALHPGAP